MIRQKQINNDLDNNSKELMNETTYTYKQGQLDGIHLFYNQISIAIDFILDEGRFYTKDDIYMFLSATKDSVICNFVGKSPYSAVRKAPYSEGGYDSISKYCSNIKKLMSKHYSQKYEKKDIEQYIEIIYNMLTKELEKSFELDTGIDSDLGPDTKKLMEKILTKKSQELANKKQDEKEIKENDEEYTDR